MKCSLVPPDLVEPAWPLVKPHLMRVIHMTAGRYTIHDVLEKLLSGQHQLWVAVDDDKNGEIVGVITTSFLQYPSRRMLSYDLCAGTDLPLWYEEMHALVERYAKDHGCDGLEIVGRRGWGRTLKDYGWQEESFVFRLDFLDADEQHDAA